MEQKITPTPWILIKNPHRPTEVTDQTGDNTILEMSSTHLKTTQNYNASAIVFAVNNTYGAGIRPESVPDLLKALNLIAKHFFHEGNNSYESLGLQSIYKAAIEKAKL